jgi:hypothetical protein
MTLAMHEAKKARAGDNEALSHADCNGVRPTSKGKGLGVEAGYRIIIESPKENSNFVGCVRSSDPLRRPTRRKLQ